MAKRNPRAVGDLARLIILTKTWLSLTLIWCLLSLNLLRSEPQWQKLYKTSHNEHNEETTRTNHARVSLNKDFRHFSVRLVTNSSVNWPQISRVTSSSVDVNKHTFNVFYSSVSRHTDGNMRSFYREGLRSVQKNTSGWIQAPRQRFLRPEKCLKPRGKTFINNKNNKKWK